jgi:glutamate racemase
MRSVGVFDSGVGGLAVLREIRAALPLSDLLYVADTLHVPYGTKPPDVILARSSAIAGFLARHQCGVVVIACNTATTHALDPLRRNFPAVRIVGIEPAVKPAARATRSGVVGILATAATLAGARVTTLIERNAAGVEVLTQPCPGLVEQVEAADLDGPATVDLLRQYTDPLIARGADAIVLGCTHFTFLRSALQRLVGSSVTLYDGAAAVARQTVRVLPVDLVGRETGPRGTSTFFTTGDPCAARPSMERLWGEPIDGMRRLTV